MASTARTSVRYEARDALPAPLAFGMGLQHAALQVSFVVLFPAIVFRAGGAENYLSWGVFASLLTAGVFTGLQALRLGRVGAGYILVGGPSTIFIAIIPTALVAGGPALLATLVVASGLVQLVSMWQLARLRQLLTPTVTSTVLMLVPVPVMPLLFDMLHQTPPGAAAAAGPLCIGLTLAVIIGLGLKGTDTLRLWTLGLAPIAGSLLAGLFGLYDTHRVAEAAWVGVPDIGWPGLDLSFGPLFWTLLPAFVLLTLIETIKSTGLFVAIQRVSWRRPRAVDFRAVQGAVAATGVSNLLTGLSATVPSTPYSESVSVVELTGVAARRVGLAIGVVYILLAFLPKGTALFLAIPDPVIAAALLPLFTLIFVAGMREVVQSGTDYRTGLIVGVSFWTGVGFQYDMIFPAYFSQFAGGLLQNGMTSGGLTALLLTVLMKLTAPRGSKFRGPLDLAELPRIRAFLGTFATASGLGVALERLEAATEETLQALLDAGSGDRRALLLTARKEDGEAILEFIVGAVGDDSSNLQDQMTLLADQPPETALASEVSFRLLRHFASAVHHQQFHDLDIVTVRVAPLPLATPPRPDGSGTPG